MQTDIQRIADTVRGAVAERRLTQEAVAEALGLSRSSVSERLNGRRSFTADDLLKLAHALHVPIARLYPTERAA